MLRRQQGWTYQRAKPVAMHAAVLGLQVLLAQLVFCAQLPEGVPLAGVSEGDATDPHCHFFFILDLHPCPAPPSGWAWQYVMVGCHQASHRNHGMVKIACAARRVQADRAHRPIVREVQCLGPLDGDGTQLPRT